jgi:3'-phosphoadenosine 5'-phosphosulfate sulfotransferase (PAPS reductase)/FAD synthetase
LTEAAKLLLLDQRMLRNLNYDGWGGVMANTVVHQGGADPRTRFVDFDGLDWDEFPPLAEWTDDDWRDAIFDSPAIIPPGDPHADFRLLQIDFREIDQDRFPPIGQWSDTEYDRAVRETREARALRDGALPERTFQDESVDFSSIPISERLECVDFQLLSLDQFPPIGEWHEEHWWQAMMAAYLEWMQHRIEDDEEELISLDQAFGGALAPAD